MNRTARTVGWAAIGLLAAAAARGAEAPQPAAKTPAPEAKAPAQPPARTPPPEAKAALPAAKPPAPEVKAPPADFTVDREKREILIPCRIAPRKLPTLTEIYPIEVVATYPSPQGQKAHETVITLTAKPSEIHKALEGLGLKPGRPVRGDEGVASGPLLDVLLELPGKGDGPRKRVSIENAMVDRRTGRTLPPLEWHFTGSVLKQPDPAKPERTYAADVGGTLIGLLPVTDELVIQSNLTPREEALLKVETAKDLLPPEGTAAVLILRVRPPGPLRPPEPASLPPTPDAAIQDVIHRQSLAPVQGGSLELPPTPATATPDAGRRRPDVSAGAPSPEEARPVALPPPPLPREAPASK